MKENQNNLILIEDLGLLYPSANSKQKRRYGLYECSVCKSHFKAISYDIKRRNINKCLSCSYNIDRAKHNMHKTRLYKIWNNMKQRVCNPNNKDFDSYGGKGIIICDEWKNDFLPFRDWALSNGYQDNLTIDRKDNNGNYGPENCRWTTQEVQSRNTRKIYAHNSSGFRGITIRKRKNGVVFESYIKVKGKVIYLGVFKTEMEAILNRDEYIASNSLEHTKNL